MGKANLDKVDLDERAQGEMASAAEPAGTGVPGTGASAAEEAMRQGVAPPTVTRGRLDPLGRARRLKQRIRVPRVGPIAYLAAIGPGLIAANAGNDAGGIATYSSVGASYGYSLLWMMVIITISLGLVQEMCSRMGAVTGKGLGALIRENFGIRLVTFAMLAVLVANGGTAISEFVGLGAALGLVGVAPVVGVPLLAALIWWLVARGSYRRVEIIFLLMTLAFFSYPISAVLAHPDWGQVAHHAVVPSFRLSAAYIFTFVATVGTTITPYMQFYVQSSVVEKNVTMRTYRFTRLDAFSGAIFSNIVAAFIIICTGATLFTHHISVTLASDAARALVPLVGSYAQYVFAVGLFGASMLAAAVLPLATSYALTETFGLERGVDKRLREAPAFWGIFTGLIVLGALVGMLIPRGAVVTLLLVVQVINGVLLPILLIFIIRLVNDSEVMGEHTNGHVYNVLAWITVVVVAALSLLMVATTVLPSLGLHVLGQ
jgi:Mn2+/Fe2+ NRAMP family transporter